MRLFGVFAVLAAAAVIAFLVSFKPIAPPHFLLPTVKPYVIALDGGGFLTSYISLYSALKRSGVPVEVAGECDSACTLIFTLPHEQVCAWPEAIFGFHAASTDMVHPDKEITKRFAKQYYPEPLRSWFLKNAANSLKLVYRKASDFFPLCK